MSLSARCAVFLALGFLTLAPGCAQPGPLASRRTTVGSLKASMAQLEHERDVLKNEVAELKTENRRVSEQVAQQEETNGELHTRLDNARNLIRRQGLDSRELATPADSDSEFDSDRSTTTRTRGHRIPAAQIPSPRSSRDIEDDEPLEDDDAEPLQRVVRELELAEQRHPFQEVAADCQWSECVAEIGGEMSGSSPLA